MLIPFEINLETQLLIEPFYIKDFFVKEFYIKDKKKRMYLWTFGQLLLYKTSSTSKGKIKKTQIKVSKS